MSEILNLSFRGVRNNPTEKIHRVENHFRNMNLDIGDYKWSAKFK